MRLIARPASTLQGQVTLPGDKSISHRALLIGALAQGITQIDGFLEGEDCLHTLKALVALGVPIQREENQRVIIRGVGLNGFAPPTHPLYCGNSGTSMRLLAGMLAAQPFVSTLEGDASLSKRPMSRIVLPLRQMGAQIEGRVIGNEIYPPLHIQGQKLSRITYRLPVASAQVKSALLLAGLCAKSPVHIMEPSAARDHTEKMLNHFGASLFIDNESITLEPSSLAAKRVIVPGDFSSAAFFLAGASFTPGSHLYLKDVGVNPRRIGLIHILREMGAKIVLHHAREIAGEPIADIEVFGAKLQGIEVKQNYVASTIDEFPILFVACAAATGTSLIHGIRELRYKESDRIAVMVQGLKKLGIEVTEREDGVSICGGIFHAAKIDSQCDHRVSMAFLMASLNATMPIEVENCENIATSFPGFQMLANQLGLSLVSVGE